MRFDNRTFLALAFLAAATHPLPAAAGPYDTAVLVEPYDTTKSFSWNDALAEVPPVSLPASGSPIIVAQPVHGTLGEIVAGTLDYTPQDSFWKLGTDSFVYRVDPPEGASSFYVTVTLQASDHGTYQRITETFEQPGTQGLSGNAQVVAGAAIAGDRGMRASVLDGLAPAAILTYLNYGTICESELPGCGDIGPGAQGGEEELKLRPPPPPPGGGFGTGSTVDSIVIYSLDRAVGQDVAADLVLTRGIGGWDLAARLYTPTSTYSTTPFPLTAAEHELRLDWWNAWEGRTGGLKLWIDDELVDSILGVADWFVLDGNRRVGTMLDPTASAGATVDLDDVHFRSAGWARASFAPLVLDNFEDDLAAWNTSQAAYIDVEASAAMVGAKGLEISPIFGYDGSIRDSSPAAEKDLGVRMQLSTDGLAMPFGRSLEFLALSDFDDGGASGDQVRLVIRKSRKEFELIARTRADGTWFSSPAFELVAGPQTLELRWQAADEGALNGSLQVWVDGTLVIEATGLDNSDAAIESLRLGAWAVDPNLQGALHIDCFEAWSAAPRF